MGATEFGDTGSIYLLDINDMMISFDYYSSREHRKQIIDNWFSDEFYIRSKFIEIKCICIRPNVATKRVRKKDGLNQGAKKQPVAMKGVNMP